ncbi:MAG: hypothetical protein DRN61_04185 [Thaumarchaeota archaeon]|nr:MAG: hypothetical protein DRN61_04185 [Nitrososphaerota archaeon]
MSFKIKVGKREYSIDLPAYVIPYVNLLGSGLAGIPQTAGSAKQAAEDLKAAMEELSRFIEPKPSQEDWLELIFKLVAEVSNEIRRAVRAAGFSSEPTGAR